MSIPRNNTNLIRYAIKTTNQQKILQMILKTHVNKIGPHVNEDQIEFRKELENQLTQIDKLIS